MFKTMLKAMVSMSVFFYKLTGGVMGGSMQSMSVLLLTTTGRTSGKTRTVPLTYFKDNSAYVITASYMGLPRNPA